MQRIKRFLGFGVTAVLLALGLSLTLTLAGCGEAGDAEDTGDVTFSVALPPASLDGTKGAVAPDLRTLQSIDVAYTGPVNSSRSFPVAEEITLTLPRGSYELTITGTNSNGIPVAQATKKMVLTSSGKAVEAFIGPIPGAGNGTFKWDITPPSQNSSVDIELTDLNNEIVVYPYSGKASGTDGRQLPSGSYRMLVTLTGGVSYETVVHIYAGMTTQMTLEAKTFINGKEDQVTISIKSNVFTHGENDTTFTVDADLEDGQWSFDGVPVDPMPNVVDAASFDWEQYAETAHPSIGSHRVGFVGKEGYAWFTGTVVVNREQPTLAAYYVDATNGNDNNDGGAPDYSFKTLAYALAAPTAASGKTIYINGEYAITTGGEYEPEDTVTTTTITRTDQGLAPATDAVIKVTGGEVTFKNVTINGLYDPEVDEDSKAENRGLLVTGAGTSVTLDTGTTVTGKITGSNGGGVLVESGATLTMKGGSKVTGSRTTGNGGGVAVSLATFNMEGGEISGNEANRGGGVYLSGEQVGTVFSMTGSSIIYGSTNGTLVKRNIGIAEHNKGAALYRGLESAASKGTDDLTEICYEEDLTVVN